MFGVAEVLAPAKGLIDLPGIDRAVDMQTVRYFHLAFDTHEVDWANCALAESFFPGAETRKHIDLDELKPLRPFLEGPELQPALPFATVRRSKMLANRLIKNRKPTVSVDLTAKPIIGCALGEEAPCSVHDPLGRQAA